MSTEFLNTKRSNLINKPYPENRGLLRPLMAAITLMILSAAILVSGFLVWHYPQFNPTAGITPITITGDGLFIAFGRGGRQGSTLVVKELAKDGTAVISSRRTRLWT